MKRHSFVAVATALLCAPFAAQAEGPAVEHETIGCVVAGQFSKVKACFDPASTLARSRVFFKPEGKTAWYYVDMNVDPPCYSGVLPKAKKALIGSHLDYYIEGTDRQMASGRSTEHAALIVKSANECDKDKLVAPLASTGPAAVFPAMPAGMTAGGVGAMPFVLGGLAAGGGAAAIISQDDDTPPIAQPSPPPTPGPTPTAPPTPPPPPLDPLIVTCGALPQSGLAPLEVHFWVYPGGGTGNYEYTWDFGDGDSTGNKNVNHWYASEGSYTAKLTLKDGKSSVDCFKDIQVLKGRTQVLTVNDSDDSPFSWHMTSSPAGIDCTFTASASTAGVQSGTCSQAFPDGATVTLTDDTCGVQNWSTGDCDSNPTPLSCRVLMNATKNIGVFCSSSPILFAPNIANTANLMTFDSRLEAGRAKGTVAVDGAVAASLDANGPRAASAARRETHRVEGWLTDSGSAGVWRFELGRAGVVPGSLHVLQGDVTLVTPEAVAFRVAGRAGERVVFTFRTQ